MLSMLVTASYTGSSWLYHLSILSLPQHQMLNFINPLCDQCAETVLGCGHGPTHHTFVLPPKKTMIRSGEKLIERIKSRGLFTVRCGSNPSSAVSAVCS